jgi:hypothetical protein
VICLNSPSFGSLSELRQLGRQEWRNLYPETAIFRMGREKVASGS